MEFLFHSVRSGGGLFPLAFLDYGGIVFSVISFVFGRNFHLKMSSLEEWRAIVLSVGSCFWPVFFSLFFFDFESQIYTSPPFSDYHAPPSHVPRRLPPLTLQALVITVVGDRRVAPTCLEAFCFVMRVRATLRLFLAMLGGIRFYGVVSLPGWPW